MISCSIQIRGGLKSFPRAPLTPPLSLPPLAPNHRSYLRWPCTPLLLQARTPYPAWLLFSLSPEHIANLSQIIHDRYPEYPSPLIAPPVKAKLLYNGKGLQSVQTADLRSTRPWLASQEDGDHLLALLSPRHLLGWHLTLSPQHLLILMPT